MKIIGILDMIKGFFTFFIILGGVFIVNPIISTVLDLVPTSMWKTVMIIGWYLLLALALIIIPLVVMIGPENLIDKVEEKL